MALGIIGTVGAVISFVAVGNLLHRSGAPLLPVVVLDGMQFTTISRWIPIGRSWGCAWSASRGSNSAGDEPMNKYSCRRPETPLNRIESTIFNHR